MKQSQHSAAAALSLLGASLLAGCEARIEISSTPLAEPVPANSVLDQLELPEQAELERTLLETLITLDKDLVAFLTSYEESRQNRSYRSYDVNQFKYAAEEYNSLLTSLDNAKRALINEIASGSSERNAGILIELNGKLETAYGILSYKHKIDSWTGGSKGGTNSNWAHLQEAKGYLEGAIALLAYQE